MKTTTTLLLGIVIALVIGGSVGYSFGKNANDNEARTSELQDSIAMMNEQSTNIQKMAELMKSGGEMMQEMGVKYKDDGMVSSGKDLEAIGQKYMKGDVEAGSSGSMQHMMGN
ncbi:MAG: hypothetical protein A3B25_01675 [Candidatus Ryanbacteria bacterium RIFCSPLOWO2_01_FULL_48_26]|uniref:Uncharacterized protein n=1 Tax=Candidatus Ryanbacteria bacterium RIFCSPLOWO2_01_FULL_48_26 TaxID=1802126 RepID=A0A1G2GX78_9BACT|nr:MAG: hypothetical protein A3B25_01675 [Candidatus Ryanbacteria bacterium RIFCSPLOWO2_01_FULL_48_26]